MDESSKPRPKRRKPRPTAEQVRLADARAERLAALPLEVTDAASRVNVSTFFRGVRDVLAHRELLGLLVRRQLKSRYKDSSLGFLWTLIRPLTLLLIYYIAIGQFLGAARGIPEFAIFIFTGLTIWGLYAEIVQSGTGSIVDNGGLVKKVRVPRVLFPLSNVGSALVNFGAQFTILLAALILTGGFPLSWDLLYAVAAVLIVLVWGVALSLALAAANVYLRDTQYLVEVGILILFWASPIIYAWSFVVNAVNARGQSWLAEIYLLNPVSNAVLAFQRGLWLPGSRETVMPDGTVIEPQPWPSEMPLRLLIVFLVGGLVLVLFHRLFERLQGNFAQEI